MNVLRTDGGGKIHAFLKPIAGIEKLLRLYCGLFKKLTEPAEFIQSARIDGLPGYISRERDGVLQTTAFAIEDGRIVGIFVAWKPEKLRRVARLVGVAASASFCN